jgi:hydrogenase maturation protease
VSATLVIGVGNTTRGDDGAGIELARRLRERRLPNVLVRESSGEMATLLESWSGHPRVVLVDAADSGAAPGTVQRFDAHASPLPSSLLRTSSHALGVAHAVEMARRLGRLPPVVVVYAIEGANFSFGAPLSAPVRAAVRQVAARVLRETRREAP